MNLVIYVRHRVLLFPQARAELRLFINLHLSLMVFVTCWHVGHEQCLVPLVHPFSQVILQRATELEV
jgi:hypothetical protein